MEKAPRVICDWEVGKEPPELLHVYNGKMLFREVDGASRGECMPIRYIPAQVMFSLANETNPVDGIWCSNCEWAGRVDEDATDPDISEEPRFDEFSEYIPRFCPNCGAELLFRDEKVSKQKA